MLMSGGNCQQHVSATLTHATSQRTVDNVHHVRAVLLHAQKGEQESEPVRCTSLQCLTLVAEVDADLASSSSTMSPWPSKAATIIGVEPLLVATFGLAW